LIDIIDLWFLTRNFTGPVLGIFRSTARFSPPRKTSLGVSARSSATEIMADALAARINYMLLKNTQATRKINRDKDFMRFAAGTLENFWQKCARIYDERMQKLTRYI